MLSIRLFTLMSHMSVSFTVCFEGKSFRKSKELNKIFKGQGIYQADQSGSLLWNIKLDRQVCREALELQIIVLGFI